jgi:hypothetical protein
MAYIGKEPQIGAYSMLDNLTASATASYSLTLDSTAFVPESANHLIVSLNGSIQKAGSSYTVSSSTLTFSSSLASSDSIDFVLALGNVLDIGTPSDSTVTNAKTNFVSTSSAAGLQIKGDNTTAGTLQLNCEQNSHGIKLRSPAHSNSQSYTLTFPTGNVTADKFLKVASVSGSGTTGIGQLSFADAGGANTLVSSGTWSSGTDTLSFDSVFTADYVRYVFYLTDVSSTSDYKLYVQTRRGGSYITSGYAFVTNGEDSGGNNLSNVDSPAGNMELNATAYFGGSVTKTSNAIIYFHNPYNSAQFTQINGLTCGVQNNNLQASSHFSSQDPTAASVTGFRVKLSAGNTQAGVKYALFGMAT